MAVERVFYAVKLRAFIALLMGMQTAMLNPNLAIFVHDDLKFSDAEFSALMLSLNASALLSGLGFPVLSDRAGKRKPYLLLSIAVSMLGFFCYLRFNDFPLILAATALFIGPSTCMISLFFSYLRAADGNSSSGIASRSILSFAWVVGPAMGTFLIQQFGFQILFLLLIGANFFAASMVAVLPDTTAAKPAVQHGRPVTPEMLILLVAAFVLLQASNVLSVLVTPLIITETLGYPIWMSGLVFSVCAIAEVPMFYLVGGSINRFGERKTVIFGCAAGIAYYVTLGLAQAWWLLLSIQILNAIFIATIMGAGMSWFQNLMPDRPGLSTALFMSTFRVGGMLITPVLAFANGSGRGYQNSALVAGAIVAAGLLVLVVERSRGAVPSTKTIA
ncbi:MFS transporter [Rhizobium leguminosarum]|nr:MFS transporter [Rhizobium leguminosarum]